MTSRHPLKALWAALLVVIVAFYAVVPVQSPLSLRSGSAFSADTVEVATAPQRQVSSVRHLVRLPAIEPLALLLIAVLPFVVTIAGAAVLRRPPSTAPPARGAPLSRKSAPRAPPIT